VSSVEDNKSLEFKDLPGPRGLPWLGNALQLDPARMQEVIENWADQYGTPYRIQIGSRKAVVIADADMARQAFRERPDTFRRYRPLEAIAQEMNILGLFPAEGDDWRRQRRAWMQALNFHQVKPFFASLTETTERLRKRWQKAAINGEPVDVQADLMRYTVDVTTQFAFGHDSNTLEQDGDVIQQHLGKVFHMINRRLAMPIPYWRWFKLPSDRDLEKSLLAVREFAHEMIERSRQRIAANPELAKHPTNLIEALLVSRDEDGSTYSDDEIYGNAIVALLAGEDTTANTIAWMIHMLTLHPGAQQRMQQEIDQALGGNLLWQQLEDADRLTYIDAVTNETLRLKPVAPLIFLCANEDTMLGNLRLKEGTNVIMALRHLSTRSEEFSDPDAFDPDRWLQGGKQQRGENLPPMPFGGGPRMCPGRNLAQMEIKSVMAMLARNFQVEAWDEQPVTEKFSFTLMPKNLRARFSPRSHEQRRVA